MRVCDKCGRVFDDDVSSCDEKGHPPLPAPRALGIEMIEGYHFDRLIQNSIARESFRAHHIATGRGCLVHLHRSDPEYSDQFISQALEAATLNHPNVADVYTAGTLANEGCYVIEEETTGEPLRGTLDGTPPDELITTIRVVRQVAEALQAIHEKGLVHRAIRPENIYLVSDDEGEVTVRLHGIDYAGIHERSILSNKLLMDSGIDSLVYYSPEQCLSEQVSNRSDLYSLGIVLYEMLAGHPPFEPTSAAALINMHANAVPADIRIDDPALGMLLIHTLTESLRKSPERREPSALAFARQMRHIEQLALHSSEQPHNAEPHVESHTEPVVVAAAAAAASIAQTRSVPPEPTAVTEFEPVDDIPTLADVLDVVSKESLPAISVERIVNAAESEKHSSAATERPMYSPTSAYRHASPAMVKGAILVGAGALAMLAVILLSSVFIGMNDAAATLATDSSSASAIPQPDNRQRAPKAPGPFAMVPPVSDPLVSSEPRIINTVHQNVSSDQAKLRSDTVVASKPKRRTRGLVVSKFVPTTLVIYAEEGVIKSRVEPQPSMANKKTLSIKN